MSKTAVIFGLVAIVLVVLLLGTLFGAFGFVAHKVKPNEVGVVLHEGRVTELVGPGIYTRFGLFWDIEDIKVEGLTACTTDPEVLTRDQQRIGVTTCSTVHRPGATTSLEDYAHIFGTFRTLLVDDEALVGTYEERDGVRTLIIEGKMQEIKKQALKSCVGDRRFEEAAVGASRDELRQCLFERENEIATGYLLTVKNVTVPNIDIHPSVQEKLDQITNEKFQTDLERQETLRIQAEAEKELARQQGNIKVQQGTIQEDQRQKAVTADLERQATEAQMAVIEAQKANELASAQLDLEIALANLDVRAAQALANLAGEQALAELYVENPEYVDYLIKIAQAESWGETDKIFGQPGLQPETILSPSGDVSIVVEPGE